MIKGRTKASKSIVMVGSEEMRKQWRQVTGAEDQKTIGKRAFSQQVAAAFASDLQRNRSLQDTQAKRTSYTTHIGKPPSHLSCAGCARMKRDHSMSEGHMRGWLSDMCS